MQFSKEQVIAYKLGRSLMRLHKEETGNEGSSLAAMLLWIQSKTSGDQQWQIRREFEEKEEGGSQVEESPYVSYLYGRNAWWRR